MKFQYIHYTNKIILLKAIFHNSQGLFYFLKKNLEKHTADLTIEILPFQSGQGIIKFFSHNTAVLPLIE